jgi:hypothetical protein
MYGAGYLSVLTNQYSVGPSASAGRAVKNFGGFPAYAVLRRALGAPFVNRCSNLKAPLCSGHLSSPMTDLSDMKLMVILHVQRPWEGKASHFGLHASVLRSRTRTLCKVRVQIDKHPYGAGGQGSSLVAHLRRCGVRVPFFFFFFFFFFCASEGISSPWNRSTKQERVGRLMHA